MSQMPRQAALPTCPSCAEPLDAGDRFCGACGYDLSAVPQCPDDHPTLTMNGSAQPAPAQAAAGPTGPTVSGTAVPGTGPIGARVSGAGFGDAGFHGAAAAAPPPQSAPGAPAPPHAGASVPPGSGTPGPHASGAPVPHGPGASQPHAPGAPVPSAPGAPLPSGPAASPASGDSGVTGGAGVSGVRFDRPSEPDEYALQAPDPRVAAEAAVVAETAQVCVACRAGRVDDDGYCENCGHAQPRERDHMELESGPLAAVSDRGLRHHRNEDAFGLGRTALPDGSPALVAIVCDGVSSATRPDDASLAASKTARESLLAALPQGTHPQQAMHEAIVAASYAVNALADEPATAREHAPHQNAPACTLVGSIVTPGLLVVGWVGDSRAYWVPADRSSPPARLTEDDSWAAQMVAAGLMSEAEAYADERAHAITGWLGADAYELEPHTASFKPDRPGVVVVCTDGLWNYAEAAEEMAEVLPPDASTRPLHSARVLVGHALDGGGHDNVTVAVVPFPAPAQGAGSA
ncbi:protein phosphatase 2C domain-containing protein [Streptomyces sp. Root1310]|uniref:PP2C family serine/threonine-protein phosphatase n=1 Tax=Streptomyces sp. Root1310 TaxID=1736452 RepID=UPI0007109986|nr:protein phosphatase 2C domain-containing protein [Streptomyces sp. Root1310]KQX83521.1 serine/threonine protein phosphatase [Streptomyces sp. Root1310]